MNGDPNPRIYLHLKNCRQMKPYEEPLNVDFYCNVNWAAEFKLPKDMPESDRLHWIVKAGKQRFFRWVKLRIFIPCMVAVAAALVGIYYLFWPTENLKYALDWLSNLVKKLTLWDNFPLCWIISITFMVSVIVWFWRSIVDGFFSMCRKLKRILPKREFMKISTLTRQPGEEPKLIDRILSKLDEPTFWKTTLWKSIPGFAGLLLFFFKWTPFIIVGLLMVYSRINQYFFHYPFLHKTKMRSKSNRVTPKQLNTSQRAKL